MANVAQETPILVVCGGIHPTELTDSFINNYLALFVNFEVTNICRIPTQQIAPYDVMRIHKFLQQQYGHPSDSPPLILVSFSAGVVGCIGLGRMWSRNGGQINSLFAFDGWGVPLIAPFPCYRLSHDYFTYVTSRILGGDEHAFYAHPAVSHLDLWRSPNLVQGYWMNNHQLVRACRLLDFMAYLLPSN